MRVLLDECVHERFRTYFSGHDCQTARYAKLTGLENGALLTAAERAGFEVLLTLDQHMEHQQNLARRKLAIIVVHAKSNTMKDLSTHALACLTALESIRPGQLVKIGG